MPRYFFDVRDRSLSYGDDVGCECADLDAIKRRAQRVLGDALTQEQHNTDGLHIVVCVRNGAGAKVYMATLLIVGNAL